MGETRGENIDTKEEKKPERFVCIWCSYIWMTKDYSDPENFRFNYKKIRAKCPVCGSETEKPIKIN